MYVRVLVAQRLHFFNMTDAIGKFGNFKEDVSAYSSCEKWEMRMNQVHAVAAQANNAASLT